MAGHDIMVVGASAGGVEALIDLASRLPGDLPASVFIVLHFPPDGTSALPAILTRSGPLPASHAVDGERIEPGRIYVARPDQHLLVHPGMVRLARGPSENGHRPAVDPLFRSAARSYGPRVVGVILSGTLDDGTAGLAAIKSRGGTAVVQDPDDALYTGMPSSAIENVDVDHVAPLPAIAPLLDRLAHTAVVKGVTSMPERESDRVDLKTETEIAELTRDALDADRPGIPSGFGCPSCGGALWELHEGEMVRYRCRVGHAFSPDSLLAQQALGLDTALWTALRALEENAALARRLMERAEMRGQRRAGARFRLQADDAANRAELIRKVLLDATVISRAASIAAGPDDPSEGMREPGAPPEPGK